MVWRNSPEYRANKEELAELRKNPHNGLGAANASPSEYGEFAAPFSRQLFEVGKRVFQQYWRTPSYIFSKAILCIFNVSLSSCSLGGMKFRTNDLWQSLFIGFSFYMEGTSIQGLQNQMFGVVIFLFIILISITQVLPVFVEQRTMYEARERQSRTYAWQAFVLSNVLVEFFWNTASTCLRNATCRICSSLTRD